MDNLSVKKMFVKKKNYVQLRFNCNIHHIYVLIQTIFLQIETIIERRKKSYLAKYNRASQKTVNSYFCFYIV